MVLQTVQIGGSRTLIADQPQSLSVIGTGASEFLLGEYARSVHSEFGSTVQHTMASSGRLRSLEGERPVTTDPAEVL
jgi:hypothetical protein